jgi:hypothetical protein
VAIAGVPSALLQALTHQPTFGNNLVAFLCGDASVSAAAIASSSTTMYSGVFLAALSLCINSSKVIAAFAGIREAFYRPVGDYHRANAKIVIQLG